MDACDHKLTKFSIMHACIDFKSSIMNKSVQNIQKSNLINVKLDDLS